MYFSAYIGSLGSGGIGLLGWSITSPSPSQISMCPLRRKLGYSSDTTIRLPLTFPVYSITENDTADNTDAKANNA